MLYSKNELIKKALKNVADIHGISIEEVEKEIEKALKAAGMNERAGTAVEKLADKTMDRILRTGKK